MLNPLRICSGFVQILMKSPQSLPSNHEVSHKPWNSWAAQGLIAKEHHYVILNFIF